MLSARVERLPAVDRGTIADFYIGHASDAVRLAYLLTGDRELAEDLVQDAFVRLTGRLVHLRHPDAFAAYLRTTVVNLSRSYFRRKKVERAHIERAGGLLGDVQAPATNIEEREELWRALGRLNPRQRAAIVLRFYEDLPESEIADVLRCRPGTVKSLVSRGLEILRNDIRGDQR